MFILEKYCIMSIIYFRDWEIVMAICYLCNEEITEKNKTEEHILLNLIGG
jgi:hypothetical protein